MNRWRLLILFGWLLSAAAFYLLAWPLLGMWPLRTPEAGVTEVPTGDLVYTNRPLDAEALLRDAREYGALTNLVKLLIERGEFCRVQGHAWCADLKGYPAEQADRPEWRECLVCGREEERGSKNKSWRHGNP